MGETVKGRNKYAKKLNMEIAEEIRKMYQEGYTQTEVSKKFNVSQVTVSKVISRKTWI